MTPWWRGALRLMFMVFVAMGPFGRTFAHDNERPPALRNVALDQMLGAQIPAELEFRDEIGQLVRLGDLLGRRPVVFSLIYYDCENLCPLLLDGIVRALRPLSFDAGNQFEVVTVSIDPGETPALAAAKKRDVLKRYARPGTDRGWHFFTGDAAAIRQLSEAVGFRYNYDREKNRFSHAAGILLLTPAGKITRYFYGTEFSPRDLRLAIIEASADKIGSVIDQLLLFCYHYDPAAAKYTLLVTQILRVAGLATVLALTLYIVAALRRQPPRTDAAKSI